MIRNVLGGSIRVATSILNENGDPILDDDGIPQKKMVTRPTHVLDLIENRTALEDNVERLVRIEGEKAGVDIKEIRFLDPDLPPELRNLSTTLRHRRFLFTDSFLLLWKWRVG